ncbi:MAG: hypothetical protein SGBAC_005825 [Bacillariaceae sp.]
MKLLLVGLLVVTAQAVDLRSLRGVSVEEDQRFYDRLLQDNVASMTAAPDTPAPTIPRVETPAPTGRPTQLGEETLPPVTAVPTIAATLSPTTQGQGTEAPSAMPTPCKVLTVECPERCWEVDPFDRNPLCIDFNRPDCDTIPFPADSCPQCCPMICNDAPELGDCSPTPVPTTFPSESPSATPTGTASPTVPVSASPTQCIPPPNCPSLCGEPNPPTDQCSEECIACPPAGCDVSISITPDCPLLPCEWDVCQETPSRLQFAYNGGDCLETEFLRCAGDTPDYCTCDKQPLDQLDWPIGYTCQDFNGGPPATNAVGTRSWIRASPAGSNVVYFEGVVRVGESFDATTASGQVATNMDIFIYEYDATNSGPGVLLQQVLFDSSCSQQLFLTDTFGASQLVEFQSPNALVSLFQTQAFAFNLNLEMNLGNTELELNQANVVLLSADFLSPQFKTLPVNGAKIPPPLSVLEDFVIIPDQNHTAIASFAGLLDGSVCNALESVTFNCPRG